MSDDHPLLDWNAHSRRTCLCASRFLSFRRFGFVTFGAPLGGCVPVEPATHLSVARGNQFRAERGVTTIPPSQVARGPVTANKLWVERGSWIPVDTT